MNIQTAHSNRPSAREAAGELKAGLQALVPKMVLFFSSSTYPPEDVAGEMTAAFPGAAVFGCTTAGEIISGQMLKNSIDRKSTRLNSSHLVISYAVFCLKKKKRQLLPPARRTVDFGPPDY